MSRGGLKPPSATPLTHVSGEMWTTFTLNGSAIAPLSPFYFLFLFTVVIGIFKKINNSLFLAKFSTSHSRIQHPPEANEVQ
jgi:hypothetical protein